MKRDFLKELKVICSQDKSNIEKTIERADAPVYYNIHKRSLPIGIDRIVLMGLTKEQADDAINHVLKAKVYYEETEKGESKTVIYYDAIPENARPFERTIFYNSKPLIKGAV